MSKPEIFTTTYATDRAQWLHLSDDAGFMEHVKNYLSYQLANRIFQECQSGEKIITVGNIYVEDIFKLNQVEVREKVRIEDLVRCKDCKYYHEADKGHPGTDWCKRLICGTVNPNFFCADGERKDGEEVCPEPK